MQNMCKKHRKYRGTTALKNTWKFQQTSQKVEIAVNRNRSKPAVCYLEAWLMRSSWRSRGIPRGCHLLGRPRQSVLSARAHARTRTHTRTHTHTHTHTRSHTHTLTLTLTLTLSHTRARVRARARACMHRADLHHLLGWCPNCVCVCVIYLSSAEAPSPEKVRDASVLLRLLV